MNSSVFKSQSARFSLSELTLIRTNLRKMKEIYRNSVRWKLIDGQLKPPNSDCSTEALAKIGLYFKHALYTIAVE